MIRQAKWPDLVTVVSMANDMHAEGGFADVAFDFDHTAAYGRRVMDDDDGLFLVWEKNGELVGFLTARVMPFLFSPDRVAINDAWYVRPEHRGGIGGLLLLARYYDWAVAHGAKRVNIAVSNETAMNEIDRLVSRFGWQPYGVIYKRS